MTSVRFFPLALAVAVLALFAAGPPDTAFGDTVAVDTTSDANLTGCSGAAGDCSLRGAIDRLNATTGPHTIAFAIPADTDPGCSAVTGLCTIKPLSALPVTTEEMTIDGYSQPGSTENTNTVGAGLNTVLKIELDGSSAGITDGLVLAGGNSTVRGLVINRFNGSSVKFQTNVGNNVEGNFIGTNVDGTAAADTGAAAAGIMVQSGAHDIAIGGFDPARRNLISGNNGDGIRFDAVNGGLVVGNLIGTDITGTLDVGNTANGVRITGAGAINHLIGENVAGSTNVISGNTLDGVFIEGAGATTNSVMGNLIGTKVGGTEALPNSSDGVELSGAPANILGGVAAADRNVISGNTQNGVRIGGSGASGNMVMGSYIGANSSGLFTLGNGAAGVLISSAPNNCIGGVIVSSVCTATAGAGNLIGGSAAFHGVEIIGTPATGNVIVGNGIQFNVLSGVDINGAGGNTIGGTNALARNIISSNQGNGVVISGLGASNNQVQGNYIGTNAAGTAALANDDGVLVASSNNCIGGGIISSVCTPVAGAGNVISGNSFNGVNINSGTGTTVLSNYIGTNAAGAAALANGAVGIRVATSSNFIGGTSGTTPGGACTGACNVISGNFLRGIEVITGATGNQVLGNFIGLNAAGTAALANTGGGMTVSSGNTIGGTTPQARNVISGNNGHGISLDSGNTVQGNYIGTNSTGTTGVPNTFGNGIRIVGASNTIGGVALGEGNTIAFNGLNGVSVDGAGATGNSIRGNSIHSNTFAGIQNINGGNDGLAPPEITSAGSASGTSTCEGCTVDVYSDNADEGRVYQGSATVAGGAWSFSGAVVGPNVTATVFDAVSENTSMFSGAFACADNENDDICDSGDPDDDNDGWLDTAEGTVGTDPLDACADTATPNDERGPDFSEPVPPWPPDFNDDGSVTGADLSAVAGVIGQGVPPAPVRRDIGQPPDAAITGADLSAVAGRIGTSCVP